MARYIDADVLKEAINYFYTHTGDQTTNAEHHAYGVALKELDRTPTADVVEVKHGHWIPIVEQDDYLSPPCCNIVKCSECGQEADVSFHDAKYCYMCGAKMDGGVNDG